MDIRGCHREASLRILLGFLTTFHRDKWFEARERLLKGTDE